MADSVENTSPRTSSTTTPFYTSEDPSFETHAGWIADSDAALDCAYLETVARNREEVLRTKHETGLSEEERRNNELLGVLREEFPYAFAERVDIKTGERYYEMGVASQPITQELPENDQDLNTFQSLRRQLYEDDAIISDYDLNRLLSRDKLMRNVCISRIGIQFEGWNSRRAVALDKLEPHRQENLLRILNYLNERGRILKEQLERERSATTPDGLRQRIQEIKNRAK